MSRYKHNIRRMNMKIMGKINARQDYLTGYPIIQEPGCCFCSNPAICKRSCCNKNETK